MESMLQFVLVQLGATRGQWDKVAAGSGVSERTIEKIGYGTVTNPRVKTVEQLARYFKKLDS